MALSQLQLIEGGMGDLIWIVWTMNKGFKTCLTGCFTGCLRRHRVHGMHGILQLQPDCFVHHPLTIYT